MKTYLKTAAFAAVLLLTTGVLGTAAAWACTLPRVEQVDFKNNESVSVDHTANTAHGEMETAKTIKQFEGNDEIEWKSPKEGEVKKNWPLSYVQESKMVVEARSSAGEAVQKCLEKEIEEKSKPTLIGEATINGSGVTFKKEFTMAEIKTQLEAEKKGFLTTGSMEANVALPSKVFYEKIKIKWKWKAIEKGGKEIKGENESTHNLYVKFKRALSGNTIYLTYLDVDTLNIEKEGTPPGETKTIAGAWKGFSQVESSVPSAHIRAYEPAKGEFSTREGTVLWYYSNITPGKNLPELVQEEIANGGRSCTGGGPTGLLENLQGRCGTWGLTFQNALAIEGVGSQEVNVVVKYGGGEKACEAAEVCSMLVKEWSFGTVGPAEEFPYESKAVVDTEGVAGQGVKNPEPFFWDHVIVKAGPSGSALLYDPSYGTGPFNGKEGGGMPSVESVLKEYQKASISGFCRPGVLEAFGTPARCQKTPTALELNAGAGFTFP